MLRSFWDRIVNFITPDAPKNWASNPKNFAPDLPVSTFAAEMGGRLRIGVIVGHTKKSPGAVVQAPLKTYEYFENSKIALAMKDFAQKMYPFHTEVKVYYRDVGGIAGAYRQAASDKCDCVIELHFNAFNKKAHGTETLATVSALDQSFAKVVQTSMVKLFNRTGIANRGIKTLTLKDRGGASVHSLPTMANCLVEPIFSDNLAEMNLYMSKREEYPKALVLACVEWAKQKNILKSH